MRAMLIDKFEGPEAIRLGNAEEPHAEAHELVVRMVVAGVNPADWKACTGWLPFLSAFDPIIPGFDGAGIVESVGADVQNFRRGDRVAFMSVFPTTGKGTWAEFVRCRAVDARLIPANLSFAEAATLPVAGIAAREALVVAGGLTRGEHLLVNGGSGGTGSIAIQLGREMGAHVAATASTGNIEFLRELGVEKPIDYTKDDVSAAVTEWAGGGVDMLLDTVGNQSIAHPETMIRRGGRLIAIGTMIIREKLPDQAALQAQDIDYTRASANFLTLGEHLEALLTLAESGRLRPPPYEILPVAQAADAMCRVRNGHVRGKLLLSMDKDSDWSGR